MPPRSAPTPATFGQRLRATRKALGLTQGQLGVRMGLPEDTAAVRVSRYETDVHTPDPETAQRLANLLGVPLAYLVTADERMAEVILRFSRLTTQHQDLIVKTLRVMQDGDGDGDDQKPEATTAPAKVTRRSKPR